MEHTLHLAAGDFIKVVSPPGESTPVVGLKRKATDDDNNNNSSGTVKDPKDAGTLHNQKGTDHLGRLLL